MTDELVVDKLEQYGILGMRWGVRRSQATLDRIAGRKPGKPRPSKSQQDANRKAVRKARDQKARSDRRTARNERRSLTTDEIKTRIDRLKSERELTRLTNEDLRPIRTKLANMLSDKGWNVAGNITQASMTVLARKYISGEQLTAAEIGKYLKPKK